MDKNKKLFPQRLWELIHDQKYNFCLRWSQDGQRVYLNRAEFEAHYLRTPNNQFHTQKAISFVRQMNMYGFRKVDDCYYENDNFKRNCPHLLKSMVRRHSNKGLFAFAGSHTSASAAHLQQQQHSQYSHNTSPRHHQQVQVQLQPDQDQQQQQQQLASRPFYNQAQSQSSRTSPSSMTQSSDDGIHPQVQIQTGSGTTPPSPVTPTTAANLAAATAAAAATLGNIQQCFVEDAASSLNQISAALTAAINSNGAGQQAAPLASSLYHRLAALNFAQVSGLAEHRQRHEQHEQQHQQQVRSSAAVAAVAAAALGSAAGAELLAGGTGMQTGEHCETSPAAGTGAEFHMSDAALLQDDNVVPNRLSTQRPPINHHHHQHHQQQQHHHHQHQSQQQHHQHLQQQQLQLQLQQQQQLQHQQLLLLQQQQQPHFNIFDIPGDQQQSLAARQALQQTLIRYILQLKQPQSAPRE